jgi:hypothetical protein
VDALRATPSHCQIRTSHHISCSVLVLCLFVAGAVVLGSGSGDTWDPYRRNWCIYGRVHLVRPTAEHCSWRTYVACDAPPVASSAAIVCQLPQYHTMMVVAVQGVDKHFAKLLAVDGSCLSGAQYCAQLRSHKGDGSRSNIVCGAACCCCCCCRYRSLRKPWFTPPDPVFGIAWTALYILMGLAAYTVYEKVGWPSWALQVSLRPCCCCCSVLHADVFGSLQQE